MGTIYIEINKCCLVSFTITPTDLQFLYTEEEMAATHGHPCTELASPGVVVQQLYMCLECHHRLS